MVSRRNFFAMILTMLILFFMFQFTGIAKNALNEYGVNEYEDISSAQITADNMYRADGDAGDRPYVLFVGGEDSGEIRTVVLWWCTYTKRGFEEQGDLMSYQVPGRGLPQAVVIDGKGLNLRTALPVLKEMAGRGIHLIFARMPEAGELRKNPDFCDFVGILKIQKDLVKLKGIHLFDGFLLGGERIYEAKPGEEELMDLELEVPWYVTGSATKTYLMGLVQDWGDDKNEMLPALIWRKSTGEAMVFCVCTEDLSHMYGIGFLSAMMAETDTCGIYPVVNAQNLSVVNFSGFADENEHKMKEIYSQSQTAVYRELIWPMLVSMTERSNLKITLLAAPQYDYSDAVEPENSKLIYYLKLLKEGHGELGVTAPRGSLAGALTLDAAFFRGGATDYALLSMYVENEADAESILEQDFFPKVRTITGMQEGELPPVGYFDSSTTMQAVTALAETHTYSDDLALMGFETALGYTNIALDLKPVSEPPSSAYYWENLSRRVTKNIITYWKDYRCFAGTTLAESDARIRRFLALEYRAEVQGDRMVLERNDAAGPVWFLLKVNGKTVKRMEGGSCVLLEGGFYLVEMNKQEAVIEFTKKQVVIRE